MARDYVRNGAFKTTASWEKWFWQSEHERCRACVRSCKQSSRVKIIHCPQYQKTKSA
jgi:hypothetical protein